MPTVPFLIPGDLQRRTGGYEYDRQIAAHLRARGWHVDVVALDGSFPQPTDAALAHAAQRLSACPSGTTVLIDGLALGAMPELAVAHASRLDLVALVHHPLALETGIAPALAARLRESERRALAHVRHVIVTSSGTAAALSDYGVTSDRISVAEPGTERGPLARGSADGVVRLVCVATITARKGHEVLCRALGALKDDAWRLVCVGSTSVDEATARAVQASAAAAGIADRVELVGEAGASQTAAYYDESDVFVLATWYEGYGMAVAEAIARGLPVISTPTGAIPDLVRGNAGILVPAGDVDGWIRALRRVFDRVERAQLAAGARQRRDSLSTWADTAAALEPVLASHV